MAAPVSAAALPPSLDLPAGYIVRVNAIDPTTGAQVTGVTVYNLTLEVDLISGSLPGAGEPPVLLVATV